MKVYLAAPYRRREELQRYRDDLYDKDTYGRRPIVVTNRWLDLPDGPPVTEEEVATNPSVGRSLARDDTEDLRGCDLFVVFTEPPVVTDRGATEVEWGMAIAYSKRLALVGPRTNVFHTLEEVHHFGEWAACRDWILGGCK